MSDIGEVYETSWALQWKKLYQEAMISENALQRLSLGSTHTLAVNNKGKLFSWGWNDRGQCGHHPSLINKEIDFGISPMKSLGSCEGM